MLRAHREEFQPKDFWYEYLVGAAAEGAQFWGITVWEDYYRVYAGFVEIFEWQKNAALESLYLFPRWRRRGIGTQTVKIVENGYDQLTIWASRTTASFYERLGYYRDETQGGYMMIKSPPAGKTFQEADTRLWR